MPAWTTHLVTGNIICKELDIKEEVSINSFIFGNILPDINNAIFIPDVEIKLSHKYTHFVEDKYIKGKQFSFENINKFLNEYRTQIQNPLVLGYLVHLLTDDFWNKLAYEKHYVYNEKEEIIGSKLNDGTILKCGKYNSTKLKQKEFNIYGEYLIDKYKEKIIIPKYSQEILNYSKIIKEAPINEQDIIKTQKFLNDIVKNNKTIENYQYEMFTKYELESEFENSIEFIKEKLRKI